MGVTIHYRGTLDDLDQIEAMEDRVLDLVFALGGQATLWRSFADHDRSRIVRGLMVEMEPGQDTFSLLVSPEGHLTPLFQIEDAEKTPFDEPPFCFVKTQFGSLQGHVAVVHLLDALNRRYCSNLEVSDEGEYYENRDVDELFRKMQFLNSANRSLADGLRQHGLSDEAAEDPDILATRIERVASLVHQKIIADQSESDSPSGIPSNDDWNEPLLEEEVQLMDSLRRRDQLRNDRMARRIEEGMSAEEAIKLAMQDEGLTPSDRKTSDAEVLGCEQMDADTETSAEPWLESLPSHEFDDSDFRAKKTIHPAVEQAQELLMQAMALGLSQTNESSFACVLIRGCMNMVGGLVQATSDSLDDSADRALAIAQLKRALSGHAFARGAAFSLHAENAISDQQSAGIHGKLESLLQFIHARIEDAWEQ